MDARRASVDVLYSGVDIMDAVEKDLISFSYTDNASGESDTISISLKDNHRNWMGPWFPIKGDILKTTIKTTNWRRDKDKQSLSCGLFFIDQPEYSGPPGVLTIGAISSPINSNFKNVERSRAWKNITLKAIANDIAFRAGLSLQFFGKINPKYRLKEQTEMPDSEFLSELCEEEGLGMKVTDRKIIIFDEEEFEKRKPVDTYHRAEDRVIDYSFKSALSNTAYVGCNVKYKDPKTGKMVEFLYMLDDGTTILSPALKKAKEAEKKKKAEEERKKKEKQRLADEKKRKKGKKVPNRKEKERPDEKEEEPKIYQLNAKVQNVDEAKRLAQKTLRNLNKNEIEATLTVVGSVDLVGAACIEIKDFGFFSGKYYIQQAQHEIGKGYTVRVDMRKVG